jgi:hypothetical protein
MPLRLFMRQLLRPQLGFQRGVTRGFLREAALLAEKPEDYALRKLFREKTGFDVLDFMDLSLATFVAVNDGARSLRANYFSPLIGTYTETTILSFLSSIALTYPQLVRFCRSLTNTEIKVASEFFEFPVLTRYPFFRSGEIMICWHPMVLYRGLESFVHLVLSEHGQEYMDRFSRLFEQHVVTEAQRVPTRFIGEGELLEYIDVETQVPDGLLSFPGCNVFVESKAGLFNESAMTVGSSELFAHKTRAIRTAMGQAWATAVSLRKRGLAPREVIDAATDYLLIVTNKELGASRGTALASMYPEGTLAYPNSDAERLLPLGRVYVLSIEDFERLSSAAAQGQLDLPAFLAACVEDDNAPPTARLLFEQHLNHHNVLIQFSAPVERAIDACSSRLETALSRK